MTSILMFVLEIYLWDMVKNIQCSMFAMKLSILVVTFLVIFFVEIIAICLSSPCIIGVSFAFIRSFS
jgi:hypothetical protein